jgi:hypothetical protein
MQGAAYFPWFRSILQNGVQLTTISHKLTWFYGSCAGAKTYHRSLCCLCCLQSTALLVSLTDIIHLVNYISRARTASAAQVLQSLS